MKPFNHKMHGFVCFSPSTLPSLVFFLSLSDRTSSCRPENPAFKCLVSFCSSKSTRTAAHFFSVTLLLLSCEAGASDDHTRQGSALFPPHPRESPDRPLTQLKVSEVQFFDVDYKFGSICGSPGVTTPAWTVYLVFRGQCGICAEGNDSANKTDRE